MRGRGRTASAGIPPRAPEGMKGGGWRWEAPLLTAVRGGRILGWWQRGAVSSDGAAWERPLLLGGLCEAGGGQPGAPRLPWA